MDFWLNSLHLASHVGPFIPTAMAGDANTAWHAQPAQWGRDIGEWHGEGESGIKRE